MSKNITSILDDFRLILTKMQSQGYSTEQAVTQMAQELAEETRKKPYVKSKFHIDENADDSEAFEIFVRLLILSNHPLNQKIPMYPMYQVYSGDEGSENHGENINYKGYTIYLESDKDGNWHYRIEGIMFDRTGESFSKYFAMDEAKGKIDKEIFSKW